MQEWQKCYLTVFMLHKMLALKLALAKINKCMHNMIWDVNLIIFTQKKK